MLLPVRVRFFLPPQEISVPSSSSTKGVWYKEACLPYTEREIAVPITHSLLWVLALGGWRVSDGRWVERATVVLTNRPGPSFCLAVVKGGVFEADTLYQSPKFATLWCVRV